LKQRLVLLAEHLIEWIWWRWRWC